MTESTQEVLDAVSELPAPLDPIVEARKKATVRFNRLFVYLPIIITVILAMIVFGLVVGAAVFGGNETAQATDSGLADMLVIFALLVPMTLIGAALIGGAIYLLNWRRKKGSVVRAPLQKVTTIVDQFAVTANEKAEAAQANVADRIIKTNSKAAQASALVRNVGRAAQETVEDIQRRI